MADPRPLVGIDATPLRSAHRVRGIGRYLDGVFEALGAEEPEWAARATGLLLAGDQVAPFTAARVWRTQRSSWRPQDIDPILAVPADRVAIRGRRPRAWHHTDPTVPFSPLSAKRTIVSVYDLIPLLIPEVMAGIRPHRRLAYRRYIELLGSARGLIAISETTREALIRLLDVKRERIHVVPPSVAPAFAAAAQGSAKPPVRDPCGLVFVGIPDPHKRPELAIAVLAELVDRGRDAELTMVGMHPPAIRRRLAERARTAGIDGRVRFADRIDDGALVELYRRSTTLALSSVEGFGLPPVEAALAGGRVVAVPIDAYRETLTGHAVFADAAAPAAVADAVESVQEHETSETSGLAARYGPAAVARALRDAYEALGA